MDITLEDVAKNLNNLRDQAGTGLIFAGVGLLALSAAAILQQKQISRLAKKVDTLRTVNVYNSSPTEDTQEEETTE